MITDERMRTYIRSLDTGNTPFLEELYREAKKDGVPVIRRDTQNVLKTILKLKKPKNILEVGTAIGFSTLLICEYGPKDLHITTIENYEKRIAAAKENFRAGGKEDRITLLEGDAGKILKELSGPYDMIFMDAAKGQYIHWLEDVKRLLAPAGILLSDNVLQEGDIIESRYLVERRNRTIHRRMRDYLTEITHSKELTTSILCVGDGLSLSVKEYEMELNDEKG